VAATIGWFALILQLLLTVQRTQLQGGSVLPGLDLPGFLTILTNLLVAVSLTVAARGPRGAFGRWLMRAESLAATATSILIVGLVYNLVLRGIWQPTGWQRLVDELLHVVMPLLYLVYWWLATPRTPLRLRPLLAWLLYPLGYLVYALARGALDGRYPYPFLDVTTLGHARVLLNSLVVAAAFVLVGGVLAGVQLWRSR
jgi:FAR-17a/AIG1-like protein.